MSRTSAIRRLLSSFLSSEEGDLWGDTFLELTSLHSEYDDWSEWIPKTYGDGRTPIPRDCNPIFDAWSREQRKAIRIIQCAPEGPNDRGISAWAKTYDLSDEPIDELFISLFLSDETLELAKALIAKWLLNEVSVDSMNELISQMLG